MKLIDRYENYREDTQEQLKILINSVENDESYIPMLDLLAINFDLMYSAMDDVKEKGFALKDNYRGQTKNPSLQVLSNAQQTIIRLLNNFPSNPLSKARLKKLNNDDGDSAIILDSLIS